MVLVEPRNGLAWRESPSEIRPQLLVGKSAHVVGLERERAVPTPEHGHEQRPAGVRPLEPFGIVDAVLDDDQVVALRLNFPPCKRRLLVVYFTKSLVRGSGAVGVRGGFFDEVGREAHLVLRAFPYLCVSSWRGGWRRAVKVLRRVWSAARRLYRPGC